jgi:hypothetical protein
MKYRLWQQACLYESCALGTACRGAATPAPPPVLRSCCLAPIHVVQIITTVLVTTLYLGIGDDFKPNNVMNIAAVLFMWVTMPSFGAAAYVPSLSLELSLYVRERNDGLYRPITYLINKLADELGVAVIMSLITAAAIFYGVQFQGTFLVFWFTYFSNVGFPRTHACRPHATMQAASMCWRHSLARTKLACSKGAAEFSAN